MNKLNGTSGQLFSVVAEAVNGRVTTKSTKGTGKHAAEDSSFHDLLNTVSNRGKRADGDQEQEASSKPGALQARMAQLAVRDQQTDKAGRKHRETADETNSSNKSGSSEHAAKPEAQIRPAPSAIIAPAPASLPQPQVLVGNPQAAPGRAGRSPTTLDPSGASVWAAGTAETAIPASAVSGARSSGVRELSGATAMPSGSEQSGTSLPGTLDKATAPNRSMPAGNGFQAVAADIGRAAKLSSRDVQPEATKVSVIQQETHFPPVAQFTATQQVADAVVAELKGSSAPAASAAPDPASADDAKSDQPLKILTISLDPPALGNVTVRLRLVGPAVSVQLAADRRDTSQMLEEQRGSIRALMQSAGYTADIAPVQHGFLDAAGQLQPSLSGQQQPSQGAFDSFGASTSQPQGGERQARDDRPQNQETRHVQNVVPPSSRDVVYV
jgi:chemotaxis protein MotD